MGTFLVSVVWMISAANLLTQANAPRPPRDGGYTQSAPTGGDATGDFSAGFGDNAGGGSNWIAGAASPAKVGDETEGRS